MKKYAVTLTGHYEKTISVYADTTEQAAEKVKIILFDTDLISFSEEDFVCGEAKIEDANKEDGKEKDMPDEDEDECIVYKTGIHSNLNAKDFKPKSKNAAAVHTDAELCSYASVEDDKLCLHSSSDTYRVCCGNRTKKNLIFMHVNYF